MRVTGVNEILSSVLLLLSSVSSSVSVMCSVRTVVLPVFLTVFLQVACGAGSADRTSTVPDNGLENSPLTTVRALVGHSALLPCDVTVSPAADAPILVLIFYGDKDNSVYSVDARGSSVYSGTHWSDPDRLGSRASLKLREGPQGLLLRKLVAEDAGLYRCRVDFKRSPSRNYRINLEIIFPPRHLLITSSWDEGRVVSGVIGPYPEGADLTLACQVTGGDPPSKVIWWQGGSLVDDSCEVRSKEVTRNSLRLPRLTRADLLKKYTCHASNNNITAPLSDTVTIDIAFPPSSVRIWMERSERDPILADSSGHTSGEASNQHRLVTMREGREASLACEAYGSRPQAFVLWKKNNRAVVSGNSISPTQTSKSHQTSKSSDHPLGDPSSMSSLKIIPTVEDHKAVISCTTYSPKLPDEALVDHVTLNVLYRPQLSLTYESPVSATSLEEGDGFTLVCNVHANPTAGDVQWTKDGVPVSASSPPAGVSVRASRLAVQGATRHLTGRYACAAANTEGVNTSDPLHVRVKFAPVCNSRQKMQYGTGHKEGVEIECSVDSHPAPLSFRWAFNRSSELVDIPQNSFISHGTSSTLRYIPHTELDFGFLLCWAANDVGLMEKPCMIEVIPAAKPDSVKNCRVHNNSSMPRSLVLVTCTAGYDGGLNQTFSLEVRDNDDLHSGPLASIQHSPIPVFNTKGLELGRKFLFIITAVNSRGTSPPVTLTYTTSTLLASSLASNAYDGSHMTRIPWTLFIGVIFGVLISTLVCTSICLLVDKRRSPNTQNNSTKMVYAGPIRDNDDKGGFGTLGPHGIIHCGKPGCEDEKPGSIDYLQRANNDYVTTLPQHCSDETLKETERFLCNSGPDVRMSTPQGWSQDPVTDGEDTYIRNPGYHMHSLSPPPPPPTFMIANLLTDADDQHLKHSPTSVETSSLSSLSSSQRSSSNQGSYAKCSQASFKSSSQCYSNTSADSSDTTVRRELRPDFLMVDDSASCRTPLIQLPALESAV